MRPNIARSWYFGWFFSNIFLENNIKDYPIRSFWEKKAAWSNLPVFNWQTDCYYEILKNHKLKGGKPDGEIQGRNLGQQEEAVGKCQTFRTLVKYFTWKIPFSVLQLWVWGNLLVLLERRLLQHRMPAESLAQVKFPFWCLYFWKLSVFIFSDCSIEVFILVPKTLGGFHFWH